jgi:hypothetical protein
MRLQLDIIVFKRESFNSDTLKRDVERYSDSTKFILFDAKEVKGYFKFLRFPGRLYYWLYPIAFLYDNFMIFSLFLYLCIRYKVSVIHMETYSAFSVGLLRKLGLCKKLIYVTTDWFVLDPCKGFWNKIGNKIFKFLDYLAWKNSDIVLNTSDAQINMRGKFSNKEIRYYHKLELKHLPVSPRYQPIFLGEAKKDSGLELIPNIHAIKYKSREELPELLENALCGMNVITQPNSCTKFSLSSKIMDYLQHGLPIIVTLYAGDIVWDVITQGIGYVVPPTKDAIDAAIKKCYINQKGLTENVVKYISERRCTDLYEIWKT